MCDLKGILIDHVTRVTSHIFRGASSHVTSLDATRRVLFFVTVVDVV